MSTRRNVPAFGARRAYATRPLQPAAPPPDSSFILKDLADEIIKFTQSNGTLSPVTITNAKPIASYSWIESRTMTPTIIVPGSPRVWFTGPQRVPADSGTRYIDHNLFYMRQMSPLAPLFAAIDDMNPSFDYKQFDFITDRNNLRKLLRWATGASDGKDFRIDVDVAGQTCLLTRVEGQSAETVQGFIGYGYEYEQAATRPTRGCERATGHHRMISIDMGGFKILQRFMIEACTSDNIDGEDDLLTAFSDLELGASAPPAVSTKKLPVSTIPGVSITHTSPRKVVPQSSLVEIKTRSLRRELDWDDMFPQLYLSQTAFMYIARHDRGSFNTVDKVELGAENMLPHARRAEQALAKLKVLLQDILDAVKKEDAGVGMSLVGKNGKLVLYKRKDGTGRALGKEITNKFE